MQNAISAPCFVKIPSSIVSVRGITPHESDYSKTRDILIKEQPYPALVFYPPAPDWPVCA